MCILVAIDLNVCDCVCLIFQLHVEHCKDKPPMQFPTTYKATTTWQHNYTPAVSRDIRHRPSVNRDIRHRTFSQKRYQTSDRQLVEISNIGHSVSRDIRHWTISQQRYQTSDLQLVEISDIGPSISRYIRHRTFSQQRYQTLDPRFTLYPYTPNLPDTYFQKIGRACYSYFLFFVYMKSHKIV